MIKAQKLFKKYDDKEVLIDVNIDILPGKISLILGPSGSGKTTLIKVVSLIEPPDTGTISYEKKIISFPLHSKDYEIKLYPFLTVVFQQQFLWPHKTLRENILLPLKVKNTKNILDELVDEFQMGEFIDRYPNQVSLGQRQRAAIARAFALNPKYILLDEITNALDVEQTGILIKYLLKLRNKGIGLLIVTHLIDFAKQLVAKNEGDKIYFLENGSIINTETENFFDNPQNKRINTFLKAADYWDVKENGKNRNKNQ